MKLNNKAFSLVELLIVIVISSILLASLASIFVSQSKTYSKYSDIAEIQQAGKAVLDYMAREIRMAGAGLTDRDYAFKGGSTVATFAHISSINSSTGTDAIRIRGNFQGVFGIISTIGTSVQDDDTSMETVRLAYRERAKFSKGNYITVNDISRSEIRYIYASNTNTNSVSFNNGDGFTYDHKKGVFFNGIQELRYYVSSTGILYRNNFESNGNQPVLDNVEDLQFQYAMDVNNDGYIDGWVNNIGDTLTVNGVNYVTSLSMLKQVNIWLLVRGSVISDTVDTKTYVMGDKSYTPSTSVNKYKRMLFNTTVTIRNISKES